MFVLIVVIFLVVNCDSLSESEFAEIVGACGQSPYEPIYEQSQTDARLMEFPWAAQLFFTFGEGQRKNVYCEQTLTNNVPEKSHSFGEGTLISPHYVLTTAQCLVLPPLLEVPAKLSFVRLGKWDVNSANMLDVPVAKYVAHSQYDVSHGQNDIGLVKLQSNIVYTDLIRPICLPSFEVNRVRTLANDEVIASGWGESKIEKCSHTKKKGKLYTMPSERCAEIFENVLRIGDGNFCAGGQVPYDTCAGNIGSPLMVVDFKGRWIQIGSLIRRESCERTGIPGVYTNVESYVNWILENMEGRNILLIAVSSNAGYNTSTFAV